MTLILRIDQLSDGLRVGAEVYPAALSLSVEIPGTGERFEGFVAPVVS